MMPYWNTIYNYRTMPQVVLLLMLLASISGCSVISQIRNKWLPPKQYVLDPDISTTQLVSHVNKNISPLVSWQSSDVKIHTKTKGGIPLRISANLAVESPRNFRLIARSIAGNEADFGSNNERFWFWMKRSPDKRVITVSHEHFPQVRHRMQMPFHPDWMMEALGVVLVDDSNVTVEKDPSNAGILQLISTEKSATGQEVHRIIQVDTRQGYILAHSLYSNDGALIAQATLNRYKIDKESGIAMPHEIKLNWPQNNMQMILVIGEIEVNPVDLSEDIWQLPNIPNSPLLDLTAQFNSRTMRR